MMVPARTPGSRAVTFLVAGAVATGTLDGSHDDYRQAAETMAAAGIPPSDRDQFVDAARADAAQIISGRAGQIDRDAAELLAQGELS